MSSRTSDFTKLITWSNKNFSHLPWREDRSLYSTWISEVMLQQTTVYTVMSRLVLFLEKFPTIKALSKATDEELLIAWKGLGYYQRAKNLRKAALKITNEYKGALPEDLDELKTIPGIGPYTSGAIYSIGMNKKALAVDANLERVLSRYYGINVVKGVKLKEEIQRLFENKSILKNKFQGGWRELNESLMDLGREVCQSRRAHCEICPLIKNCKAKKLGTPLAFPMVDTREKERKRKFDLHLLRVVCSKGRKIVCFQKPKGTWLAGQYELPTFECFSEDSKLEQYEKKIVKSYSSLPFIKTLITKYKINNYIQEFNYSSFKKKFGDKNYELINYDEALKKLSTASLKVLEKKGEER